MSRRIKWTILGTVIWIAISTFAISMRSAQIEQYYIAGISCNYYLTEHDVNVIACMNTDIREERWYTLSDSEYVMEFPEDVKVVSLLLQLNPLELGPKTGTLICGGLRWILDNGDTVYQSDIQQLENLAENSQTYNGDVYWNEDEVKLFYQYNFDDMGRLYFDSSMIQTMDSIARDNLERYNLEHYNSVVSRSWILSMVFLSLCIAVCYLKDIILKNKYKLLTVIGGGAIIGLYFWTPIDADSISIEYEINNVPEGTIIVYTTKDSDEIWNEVSLVKGKTARIRVSVSEIDLSKHIIIEFRGSFLDDILFKIKGLSIEEKNEELYHFSREEMEGMYNAFTYTDDIEVLPQYDDGISFLIDTSGARVVIPALQTYMQEESALLYERSILKNLILQKCIIFIIFGLLMWGIVEMIKIGNVQKNEV